MYCVKCGVKLEETEKKCPLCDTVVCHPDFKTDAATPLYPVGKMPKRTKTSKILSGAIVILFFVPLLISFFADLQLNGELDWFGYVAGALGVAYVCFALPLWFSKPNPVIFVPCSFLASGLYLLYISLATHGDWFLSFAFPIVGGVCVIASTVITLIHYIKKGRLYIFGGAFITLGGFMMLMEYLLSNTFDIPFIGWSVYPLVALILLGGLLIYIAISSNAREIIERKFFF